MYATFTRKPKLVVQVWNETSQSILNSVEFDEGCQIAPITNDMKWPGEAALNVGKKIDRGRYSIVFTVS